MVDAMSKGDDASFDQYMAQLKTAAVGASAPNPCNDAALRKEEAGMALFSSNHTPAPHWTKKWRPLPNFRNIARKASRLLASSEERSRTPFRAITMRATAPTRPTDYPEPIRQDHPSSPPPPAAQPPNARATMRAWNSAPHLHPTLRRGVAPHTRDVNPRDVTPRDVSTRDVNPNGLRSRTPDPLHSSPPEHGDHPPEQGGGSGSGRRGRRAIAQDDAMMGRRVRFSDEVQELTIPANEKASRCSQAATQSGQSGQSGPGKFGSRIQPLHPLWQVHFQAGSFTLSQL
ncbi:hypothetical protein T484DRAFT_1985153, partial [Baffinella frigidus]